MATIELETLGPELNAVNVWPALAARCQLWLAKWGVSTSDAVLLLPYAALLPLARAAFAQMGGWQPRIETTQTLAQSLAPIDAPESEGLTGDEALDRIRATVLLANQPGGSQLSNRDPRGFDTLVSLLLNAAQQLSCAAASRQPALRAAFWAEAQAALPRPSEPAQLEGSLLAVATAWAALGRPESTDTLFAMQPGAWMALRMGGPDPLADSLLTQFNGPALLLDADPLRDHPFEWFMRCAQVPTPAFWVCDDLESEAQAAASVVIEALNEGRRPVALATLDRLLIRRVRALLDRHALVLSDETGWRLSTTAAAAQVTALLRAAAHGASTDAKLDWLKGVVATEGDTAWVDVLEAHWRNRRGASPEKTQQAMSRWAQHAARLTVFARGREASLADWLELLRMALGELAHAREDGCSPHEPSLAYVLRALRIGHDDSRWHQASRELTLDLTGFTAWVDATLDNSNFEPPACIDADVVITPLARALGRSFAHVVVPGADNNSLGHASPGHSLVPLAMAERLALDSPSTQWLRRQVSVAQLLRAPRLSFLRRRFDAAAPMAPSPLVQWLAATVRSVRSVHGHLVCQEQAWHPTLRAVPREQVIRPMPTAAQALPARLSATQVEALRACPYRFFARSALRLVADEELELPVSKRDYGLWLHAVLHRFHSQRAERSDDAEALAAAARWQTKQTHQTERDAASLLPFQASFEVFKKPYLAWLTQRELNGWRWHEGETDREAKPPQLAPQTMRGRLDRVDRGPDRALELIDYKTTALSELRKRVKAPLEDTQLIFYAAMLRDEVPVARGLSAKYMAVDDSESPVLLGHDDAMASVDALLAGLGHDLQALREAAPMPALGEGPVCETCEMRGLCRKDHWPLLATTQVAPPQAASGGDTNAKADT